MPDPSSVLGALDVFGEAVEGASNWLEYAMKYKGERVQIRHHSVEPLVKEPGDARMRFYAYVVEGTIEEVVSFPPGFHLSDVQEYMETASQSWNIQNESLDMMGIDWEFTPNRQRIRGVDRKFVSFRDIDQLEFPDRPKQSEDPSTEK